MSWFVQLGVGAVENRLKAVEGLAEAEGSFMSNGFTDASRVSC